MNAFPTKRAPGEKRKIRPRPVTEERLYNAAIYYLQRYSATAAHLGTILERKVKRWTEENKEFAIGAEEKIQNVVKRVVDLGFINDALFAESRTRSLRRQGKSSQTIKMHLKQKGVKDEQILSEAMQKGDADFIDEYAPKDIDYDVTDHDTYHDPDERSAEAEMAALQKLIKRKRLLQSDDPEQRQKDIAKILRAGFGWDILKKIIS